VGTDGAGAPVLVQQLGDVSVGAAPRRGVADLDGLGDVVGGIVVMRHGENALAVIERVKQRLGRAAAFASARRGGRDDLRPLGPDPRAVDTLTHELVAALIVVSLVILRLPVARALGDRADPHHPHRDPARLHPLYFTGMTANIMSISGITISIGVLVDGAIVEVENAYKRLERWIADGRRATCTRCASRR
jgi:Cu(I)/Ag(I) efflux system membrane protein CusA/SilA